MQNHVAVFDLFFPQRSGLRAVIEFIPMITTKILVDRNAFPQYTAVVVWIPDSLVPKSIFVDDGEVDGVQQ